MNDRILKGLFGAIALGGLTAGTAHAADMDNVRNGAIAYALTTLHWATYQTPGAKECPDGFNDGPREQFKILFPEGKRKYTLMETQIARESEGWHPQRDNDHGLPFREPQTKIGLGLNLDGKVGPNDFTTPDGEPDAERLLVAPGGRSLRPRLPLGLAPGLDVDPEPDRRPAERVDRRREVVPGDHCRNPCAGDREALGHRRRGHYAPGGAEGVPGRSRAVALLGHRALSCQVIRYSIGVNQGPPVAPGGPFSLADPVDQVERDEEHDQVLHGRLLSVVGRIGGAPSGVLRVALAAGGSVADRLTFVNGS